MGMPHEIWRRAHFCMLILGKTEETAKKRGIFPLTKYYFDNKLFDV